jgi:hypothetical protein
VQEDQHAALGVVGDAVDDLRALKGSALLRASVATLRGGASGAPHRYLLYGLVRHEDVGLARRPQHTVAREEGKCVPAPAKQAPFQAAGRRGGPRYQPHLSQHERHFEQQQQNKVRACTLARDGGTLVVPPGRDKHQCLHNGQRCAKVGARSSGSRLHRSACKRHSPVLRLKRTA